MSTLNRFNIGELQSFYKFKYMVETGTGMGGSVHENNHLFEKVYTFEIHKDTFDIAKDVLRGKENVHIYNTESMRGLPLILPLLAGPTLFYLDARFPGMILGDPINFDEDLYTNVPVSKELTFLLSNRNVTHDVFIIGGLHMWEEGPWQVGPFRAREEFKDANPLPIIYNSPLFANHYKVVNYADEGYLVVRPKQGL